MTFLPLLKVLNYFFFYYFTPKIDLGCYIKPVVKLHILLFSYFFFFFLGTYSFELNFQLK